MVQINLFAKQRQRQKKNMDTKGGRKEWNKLKNRN